MITFITASHNEEILSNNLLKSKIVKKYPLIIQRGYKNISKAYNDAAVKGLRIYIHHDVFLPDDFENSLLCSIEEIERFDLNWGVLGVAGAVRTASSRKIFGNLCDRGEQFGNAQYLPCVVQTLDELILIIKDDNLKFDEAIPTTHFYGADICIQANMMGKKNYVINSYLYHNSGLQRGERPEGFNEAREYMIKKYPDLKFATTCTIV